MIENIIGYSLKHKLIVLLFSGVWVVFGLYALFNIPIGAVPDVTNNQVQVITTSRDMATLDVERFLTYPVELEMANLPGVKEIRSISKFGLSVVTIVFDDDLGTYLPRQLIAEKIKSAQEKIPQGFGTPFMGPISTGLGEIYQYILDVRPEYADRYTVTDLRSIQDWIVKRQLSGIPGVVEVNTWGGFLKTYEVAIDPLRLRAVNITLEEVFTALEQNNSVAGGGYIERSNETYFIRAEGLIKRLSDIEDIVIQTKDGNPIYIKDIATVGFGHATRFGAITGNGEGEKVLGQIMMLKNANSKEVIDAVKERVAAIQGSLPEGVYINPFLERSELIGKTTFTIAENLILGFLIVLFVVVLLLGNIRSGLLIASVIPLTLLFALSMMYVFGIDANLMSLGAIDFGIIIDGAVIIVEYIAFKISHNHIELSTLKADDRQNFIDRITSQSANKMMHSAVFGQLIIVIVFIPILSLAGIEGKMFRPMALTFCFALIGAMIFCFTYVPVMASLVLKPSNPDSSNLSTKLIVFLKKIYQPTLELALRIKAIVLTLAVLLLVLAYFLFTQMGGEFVPTLDEGDFVIQPVLKTGMSLSETVKMTTRMESILKRFPEVDQVVSRIGAAEVPTDPMSMEESDIIITLHNKKSWTSAESKDQLAEVFKAALIKEIPGVEIEFTQPIEMRFNELITGVRADVAVKLFGDNLEMLYNKATEIGELIRDVPGAADVTVEKTEGLPEMTVEYDRHKIARYGLNVKKLNDIVSMGFAGKAAGTVLEGERQFDLVLKYSADIRRDLSDLQNAVVDLPNGVKVPLSEFAKISYTKGPAKISRDDTKRRIVVGVNVRNRDLESVVADIQSIINDKITLPPGYEIKYGGQFENLQQATRRLLVAVPVALILIFILLHFAFDSIRDALLIYTAIPLSAIGGVLALYIRGMPFSISAGVGFIALFGIAVLNGIVLIEHFKDMKNRGIFDKKELIVQGALDRLRPVLLTASAAALGFLPMAISTNAGAEVQRPLATVVIGGLVSATFLTLIVLPVLYSLFGQVNKVVKPALTIIFLSSALLNTGTLSAQNYLSIDDAQRIAAENNKSIKAGRLSLEQKEISVAGAREINKTEFYYAYDHNNVAANNRALHVIGANHKFKMPAVNARLKELALADVAIQKSSIDVEGYTLKAQVAALYDQIIYYHEVVHIYTELDSIYKLFEEAAIRKNELGQGGSLEKMTAQSKRMQLTMQLIDNQKDLDYAYGGLAKVMQYSEPFRVPHEVYEMEMLQTKNWQQHPLVLYHAQLVEQSRVLSDMETTNKLPEINVGAFQGFNSISSFRLYPGIQAGVAIPLSVKPYEAREAASKKEMEVRQMESQKALSDMQYYYAQLKNQMIKHAEAMQEYTDKGVALNSDILSAALSSLDNGEIDYFQYLLTVEATKLMKLNYLYHLHGYNQTVIAMNTL